MMGMGEQITTAAGRDALLERTRTIAVVGVSSDPTRASNDVSAYLLHHSDYELYFVNPRETEVLGQQAFASLADLPVVPDMVDVFRRSELLPGVVGEAIAVGAKSVWFQLGLRNDAAAATAVEAGLDVVQDRCLKIDHRIRTVD